MENNVVNKQMGLLKHMKGKIEEIERLVLDLRDLGKGIPVVEKNAQSILSFTHVLRFGISDLIVS